MALPRLASLPTPQDKLSPIAIVGIGCRFPDDATSPEKFWDMLMNKHSARRDVPPERFNLSAFYHPDADRNGTMNNRGGHFLKEDIAAFDAPFFSISPAEAKAIDPMQRILLEVVYEAAENAGIPLHTLSGTDTGCFVGSFTTDYYQLLNRDPETLPKYSATGIRQAILSNRISYFFNLKGPSVTLDTACSSSLVAVHLACQSIRSGESKQAVVGATNAIFSPDIHIEMTNLHFLSPDSVCYTFDERANGYARGEGMAALILKPLDDALRDGDTIRAVIRGTSVNSDGKTPGITLPSKDAQISLIKTAYEQAGCDPSVTGYFEAHGTGTPAGDPLETGAIGATLGQSRAVGEDGKLWVGSVKTNIGHLEGASGLAGLIKAVLSLEKGVIAPNLWFQRGNPAIDFEGWRIRVPTQATRWPTPGLRRASVNSFGYGGTNGHVIVDDAYHYLQLRGLDGKHQTNTLAIGLESDSGKGSPYLTLPASPASLLSPVGSGFSVQRPDSRSTTRTRSVSAGRSPSRSPNRSPSRGRFGGAYAPKNGTPRIFHISANEEKQMKKLAVAYCEYVDTCKPDNDDDFLGDLAYTLCQRRSLLPWGISIVASTKSELIEKLESTSSVVRRHATLPRLGFIFTGQGAQWYAMGRELSQHPVFETSLLACNRAIRNLGADWSILIELLRSERESRVNEAAISQPLCTAVQIALVDLYASWGIRPSAVVGHSSGEIPAAYATGALSLESAMVVAYWRGLLASEVKNLAPPGGMMAAGLSEEEAIKEIEALGEEFKDKVGVACINSPKSVTISGDSAALTKLQRSLTVRQLFARKLQVDTAYHSHHMLAISEEYRDCLADLDIAPMGQRKPVQMFSSVTGRLIESGDLDADYWVRNMVSSVRFSQALTKLCDASGEAEHSAVDLLIELGPHSALAGPTKQVLASLPEQTAVGIKYLSALIRGKNASVSTLEVAAELFARGYPVDTTAAQCPSGNRADLSVIVDLPSYIWNHERKYWCESRLSRDYLHRRFPRNDLLGAPFHDWNPLEPRWRNFIRLSEQPWIKEHVVQGAVLYPAAGFCCMAIEAAAQLSEIVGRRDEVVEFKLREISISRALVVPSSEEGIEVMFTMRPYADTSITSSDSWYEFRAFSCSENGNWSEHCRGQVSAAYDESYELGIVPLHTSSFEPEAGDIMVDCEELYRHLDAAGLTYGPEFQGIVDAFVRSGHAIGTVRVTDTSSVMPKQFEYPRLIHPSTLDAFLQMSIAALLQGDTKSLSHPYVPTFVEDVKVQANIAARAGQEFQVAAEGRAHGFREAYASVSAYQAHSSTPVVQLKNIKCMAITASDSAGANGAETNVPKHCFTAAWEPDVELISKEKLDEELRDKSRSNESRIKDMELVAYYFLDKTLNEVSEVEMGNMLPHHQKFFRYMQHQRDMVRSNTHEQQTEEWAKLEFNATATKIQNLIREYSSDPADFEGRMFTRMGESLPSVLRQEVEPLSLMLRDNLLYDYYTVSLGVQTTYPQVAKYVGLLSHKNPDLRCLEVGAGTGGLTVPVLGALSGYGKQKYPRFKSYTYTDVSTGFFEKAAQKFSDWTELMDFKRLDIEQDPAEQGFAVESYDLVLASNVLHATFNMEQTLQHTRKLLKPGGKLVVLDMTHPLVSVSLIWGNLPGWWNCSEPWREFGPLLDENRWNEMLQKNGFSALDGSIPDNLNPLEEGTRVLIATAVEAKVEHETSKVNTSKSVFIIKPDTQLVPKEALIEATAVLLEEKGLATEVYTLSELEKLDVTHKIIISFAELGDSVMSEIRPSTFTLLQRITQCSAGLFWVTRGGIVTSGMRPELSLFHGLARSIRSEQQGFPCITVDLDAKKILPAKEAAILISGLYDRVFTSKSPHGRLDFEYSEQQGVLHIKRAIEDGKLNRRIAARTKSLPLEDEQRDIWKSDRPLKLKVRTFGSLDSFVFDNDAAMLEPIAAGQVELEVRAVGLNFRDVLISMGEVSDNYLGNECAGIITQVGAGVDHLSVGDRVAAWCLGSFSTRMRNPACVVQRIPDNMSFHIAAALPLVYVTAYYGLAHVARLNAGEVVLIHAAAGGVGQAAIQIAKAVGARILATVGTEQKKQHIMHTYDIPEDCIFSSRNLSFVDGVQRATNGRGVDVVLNSLAGELLQATWKCIAPFGRFVEIGKKDIDLNGRLEMAPFSRNVTFTSVDVTIILRQNLKLAEEIFTAVMAMVRNEHIREPSPVAVRPFSRIEESFRLMQAGKHIGKIVLEPRAGDLVPVASEPLQDVRFRADGSYLLAGGLGGLGRSASRWMVRNGARHLIYVSRTGASAPQAKQLIRELEAAGARCFVIKCSLSDTTRLSHSIAKALQSMPPIRGVIQGAMVLKDQVFANMSHDAWTSAVRPKVQGSWALHEATLKQPLDFFVLLSSIASFVGNAGQSNYATGCTYQVALAAHRNSLGLPATAIDVGKVASVGYVAENAGTAKEQNLIKQGMLDIQEDELLAMLEVAMLPKTEGVANGHLVTGAHSTLDPSEAQESLFWSRDPVFSHMSYLRQHLTTTEEGARARTVTQQPLPTLLAAANSTHDAAASALDALKLKLSRALMVPVDEIDTSKATSAFGIDSLIAVEIRNWILREAKADVPVFEILQAASLATLASNIVAKSPLVKADGEAEG